MLKADLHCHSRVSDGALEPEQVAELAAAGGVELWALTDHDEVDGVARARKAAKACGMGFVGGVEISVTWANHTIHIVGLQIDENHPDLCAGLVKTRGGRDQRGRDMSDQLEAVGIHGAYEGALRYAGNPALLSRTHFARFLIEQGVCASVPDVFKRFLVEGKPGYVPHRWANLGEAIGWIRAAGGIAVLAHPGRYPFEGPAEAALFDEFIGHGGRAVEVVTGSHTPDQYGVYADLARHYGLLASRGSDFHAPGESRIDFAALPPLPSGLTPVWHDW